MFKLFKKSYLTAIPAILSLSTMIPSLSASECCDAPECNRIYIGAFGGGIYSNSSNAYQMGTAFFTEAEGGPLAVLGRGSLNKTSAGFGGVQLGYELSQCPISVGCSDWTIVPALELEAYWFSHSKNGEFINTTDRLPEHDFLNSFQTNTGVYLANIVLALDTSCCGSFTPYIGGGIGVARVSVKNATSTQIAPPEEGVNHFNSKRNDSCRTLAAQAKAGLRYKICESFHVFGEYRYLLVDATDFVFGSTVYATHAPTSPWLVNVKHVQNNSFVFGVQYDFSSR